MGVLVGVLFCAPSGACRVRVCLCSVERVLFNAFELALCIIEC